jgi:hypothetical protein
MFSPSSFIRSIFVFVVLFAVLFTVTKFGSPIKQQVSSVLGVKVSEQTPALPENLQKDVGSSLNAVKKQALQTNAEDVVREVSRVNKIVKDYQALQKEIEKQADEFFKKQEKDKN